MDEVRRRRVVRVGAYVVVAAGAVGVVLLGVVVWFALQFFPPGGSGRTALVHVTTGESLAQIAAEMHSAGVLASPFAFRVDNLIQGDVQVLPGYYDIPQGASFLTIRSILGGVPNAPQVDVTPGLTLAEIEGDVANEEGTSFAATFRADVAAAATTSAYHPAHSLEGLVGPGTYLISPGETPAQLLAAMQTGFAQEAAAAGLTPQSVVNGLDAYQLVIGASIVEKEGYYTKNMPDVARVIVNRLSKGMPLQMDSTVLYALGHDGGTVTPAMLRVPTPYNTYLNLGLTPTPICVVSPTALSSMLHPPAGAWLYFVLVDQSGDMHFSNTYAEQLHWESVAAKNGV